MSGSGGLTAEQKRKIEENRQKALAKRAQKTSPNKSEYGVNNNRTSGNIQKTVNFPPSTNKTSVTSTSKPLSATEVQHSGNLFKGNNLPRQTSYSSSYNKNSLSNQINKHSAYTLSNQNVVSLSSQNSSTGTYRPYTGISGGTSNNASSSNSSNKPICNTSTMNSASSKPFCNTSAGNSASGSGLYKPLSSTTSHITDSKPTQNFTGTLPSQEKTGDKQRNIFGAGVKPIKGQCILISRERFEVKVGYSPPLIELFKKMKTKLYDAVTKKWTFKLEEYEAFMKEVTVFRPHVTIEPLPKAILQVFNSQLKGNYTSKDIPNADLSEVDVSLVNSLLSFQREGVNFSVSKNGRVLIADDMGLGKTIQAICLACYYREEWPLLIIVPSSVRFDWAQQIRRWVPSIDPQEISVATTGKDTSSNQVNIVTYDLVARKAKYLQDKHFKIVIVDECHLLKNYKTARCKAALPILQNAHRVILLSGTPALSRPSELYTQISAISPFMFKFQDFGIRYCDGKHQPWGWDFSGSSNMAELQILLEEKIMIRRLKKDVLKELPAKVRQMVLLDPGAIKSTKDLKKASKVMDLKSLKGMERRGALLEYFHHTGTAKIQAVKDYLTDLFETDRKFLMFAHHQEFLDSVEELAQSKLGKYYIRIDGKTSPENRNIFCKKFQENPDYKLAILSITAANAGINLSAATLVVFGELFWNPGILVQAEDRAHRMGQQDMVSVHYLVAQNTADDQIWPLVQKKLDVLNKAGLSKDDFSSADTTTLVLKDSRQTDLMQYFEESFIEEDDMVHDSHSKKDGSLLNYFSSKKKDSSKNVPASSSLKDTNTLQTSGQRVNIEGQSSKDDFEDDLELLMEDDDWDEEPQQKKFKT
ncbi:SWI/SNF-related matrix-associated actin-dependent regulator of chromatin subfamily A-like protein [Mytilus galloprovincialis]|uniref:SWI/SNF-related matrix-associated actin-dependent regulator of chromatin subfamily A-like protein n=1 Tax=Mytilus galloprovincialis TaxID=29158 RepID=A0A8B6EQ27_MYTGA|nr:SWI/SNF-related matrix-associated actin-dependent regulator of chromatin subfamily A-like protein [Mytilus galloprovincialis]